MDDKEKELAMTAIDYYEGYTKTQRKILKTLVKVAINNVAIITPRRICELLGVTRAVVYKAFNRFKEENLVTSIDKPSDRFTTFSINQTKIQDIIQRYKNQQDIK